MVFPTFSLPSGAVCLAYLSLLAAPALAAQSYQLDTSYSGANFFDGWDFFSDADPTHGYVSYQTLANAKSLGLVSSAANSPAYMGVDSTSTLDPNGVGRKSVRISSKKSWTHGLFIGDIKHMPASVCGSWPAFWMFGPNWPNNGEIDMIEGVNYQNQNLMSLHTGPNCVMTAGTMSGSVNDMQCDGTQNGYQGCGVKSNNAATFGDPVNSGGGGVYATEWTSTAIKFWFFPRSSIPSDITSGNPNPSGWGTPQANFVGGSSCNIDSHFANHNIIFDTTFCGDWAGNVWSSDANCKSKASTCAAYVAGNPSAFKNSYWSVNSVKVYQLGNAVSTTTTSTSRTTSSTRSSTSTTTRATTSTTSTRSTTSTTSTRSTTSSTSTTSPRPNVTSPSTSSTSTRPTTSSSSTTSSRSTTTTSTSSSTSTSNTSRSTTSSSSTSTSSSSTTSRTSTSSSTSTTTSTSSSSTSTSTTSTLISSSSLTSSSTTSSTSTSSSSTPTTSTTSTTSSTSSSTSSSIIPSTSSTTSTTSTPTPTPTPSPSTSTTSTSSSAAATGPTWSPLGCYSDNVSGRALTVQVRMAASSVTIDACQKTCQGSGYTIAGLEAGNQCWCGKSFANGSTQVDPSVTGENCNTACAGDTTKICGGTNRLSAFSYGTTSGSKKRELMFKA